MSSEVIGIQDIYINGSFKKTTAETRIAELGGETREEIMAARSVHFKRGYASCKISGGLMTDNVADIEAIRNLVNGQITVLATNGIAYTVSGATSTGGDKGPDNAGVYEFSIFGDEAVPVK